MKVKFSEIESESFILFTVDRSIYYYEGLYVCMYQDKIFAYLLESDEDGIFWPRSIEKEFLLHQIFNGLSSDPIKIYFPEGKAPVDQFIPNKVYCVDACDPDMELELISIDYLIESMQAEDFLYVQWVATRKSNSGKTIHESYPAGMHTKRQKCYIHEKLYLDDYYGFSRTPTDEEEKIKFFLLYCREKAKRNNEINELKNKIFSLQRELSKIEPQKIIGIRKSE